jgi:SPP1 family predicted phage head-tail adaptor
MKTIALASLNDSCTLHTVTLTYANGEETKSFADTTVTCGFDPKPEYRNERGQLITLDADAALAVALTQTVKVQDEITCRSKRYTVDGVIPGYTVQILALKAMLPDG